MSAGWLVAERRGKVDTSRCKRHLPTLLVLVEGESSARSAIFELTCSASGFTTRSDIGPARAGPTGPDDKREEIPDPEQFQDPDNERNLFAGTVYEADDEEADRIWESVDSRMESRRRARREAAEEAAAAKERLNNPKLQAQFADLKRGLEVLKDEDWMSIPEAGNMTGKRRKQNLRLEENQNGRSYAVSDTVLADVAGRNVMLGELDKAQQEVSNFFPGNSLAELIAEWGL